MKGAAGWILGAILGLAAIGCGPRAQLRNDPFASGPRGRAPRSAERDRARDVPTTPAWDDRPGAIPGAPAAGDPLIGERAMPPDAPFGGPAPAPQPAVAGAGVPPTDPTRPDAPTPLAPRTPTAEAVSRGARTPAEEADFQAVRARLDRAGAKNKTVDVDPTTREVIFRCYIEHPRDPNVVRVFEARDPDELRAMQEVAAAIEDWVRGERGG